MRLNGDYFSAMDNGCMCLVFIMGCIKVSMGRVVLIHRHNQNARRSKCNQVAMILRAYSFHV